MADDNLKKYGEIYFTLSTGTYIAGMDIPDGKYKLVAIHGYGEVYSSNDVMGINEYMEPEEEIKDEDDTETASEFSNLVLKVGDKIIIEKCLVLKFSSKNANLSQTLVRKEVGEEIILNKGLYICGKDFKAGTYDIIALEGSGLLPILKDGSSYSMGFNYEHSEISEVKNHTFRCGDRIEFHYKDFVVKLSPSKNNFRKK